MAAQAPVFATALATRLGVEGVTALADVRSDPTAAVTVLERTLDAAGS